MHINKNSLLFCDEFFKFLLNVINFFLILENDPNENFQAFCGFCLLFLVSSLIESFEWLFGQSKNRFETKKVFGLISIVVYGTLFFLFIYIWASENGSNLAISFYKCAMPMLAFRIVLCLDVIVNFFTNNEGGIVYVVVQLSINIVNYIYIHIKYFNRDHDGLKLLFFRNKKKGAALVKLVVPEGKLMGNFEEIEINGKRIFWSKSIKENKFLFEMAGNHVPAFGILKM